MLRLLNAPCGQPLAARPRPASPVLALRPRVLAARLPPLHADTWVAAAVVLVAAAADPGWAANLGAALAGALLLAVLGWRQQSASGRLYMTARLLLRHDVCATIPLGLSGIIADLLAPSGGVKAALAAGLAAAVLHLSLQGQARVASSLQDEASIEDPDRAGGSPRSQGGASAHELLPPQPQPSDRVAHPSGGVVMPTLSLRSNLNLRSHHQLTTIAESHSICTRGRGGTPRLLRTTPSSDPCLSAPPAEEAAHLASVQPLPSRPWSGWRSTPPAPSHAQPSIETTAAPRVGPDHALGVMYSSPYLTTAVSFKVQMDHDADFEAAAASLAAAARSAVTRALVHRACSGSNGSRGGGGGGGGEGGGEITAPTAVQGPGGYAGSESSTAAAEPAGQIRLRTKVAAVRGCVELILWLQFDGNELRQDAVVAAVTGAEAEVARVAAADEWPQAGGKPLQVARVVWSAPALRQPADPAPPAPSASSLVASISGSASHSGSAAPARAPNSARMSAPDLLGFEAEWDTPAPISATPLLVALDPPIITADAGSGGASGALHVSLCLEQGGEVDGPVDVRLVLQQRAVVIAEVPRVTVGPQGASASLDVSRLEEGSAALLVLPVWSEGARMRPTTAPALLYLPLAVVPAPVAEELAGLFDSMEHEAAGKWPSAGPQAHRAHVYMEHFSPLLADMAPLLPGEADGEQLGLAGGAGAGLLAAGAAQDVARAAAGFLADWNMAATLRYLAAGLTSAGLNDVVEALAARDSSCGVPPSRRGSGHSLLSDGEIFAADADPTVGNSAVPDPAAVEAAAGAVGHVEGGEAAAGERRTHDPADGLLDNGPSLTGRQQLALAAPAVFFGFRDAGIERRCTRFRHRGARDYDTAAAAVNAVLALATLAAVAVWHGDAAAVVAEQMPGRALVQLGLCVCALVLPAVSFWAVKRLTEPRTREPFVWACHAITMLLLCRPDTPLSGQGTLGGPDIAAARLAGSSSRALAALCTAVQPASYSLHGKLRGPLFALDAALLTVMFAAAEGATWCSGFCAAAAVVAASLAACAVVDLLWRVRFLSEGSGEEAGVPSKGTR